MPFQNREDFSFTMLKVLFLGKLEQEGTRVAWGKESNTECLKNSSRSFYTTALGERPPAPIVARERMFNETISGTQEIGANLFK